MGTLLTDIEPETHAPPLTPCEICNAVAVINCSITNCPHGGQYEPTTKAVNDADSADDLREAKRVAAIAESMNIIRTLNSHKALFNVEYSENCVYFTIEKSKGIQIQFKLGVPCKIFRDYMQTTLQMEW